MKRQTVDEPFVRCSALNDTLARDGCSAVDFVTQLRNLAFEISPALLRSLGV